MLSWLADFLSFKELVSMNRNGMIKIKKPAVTPAAVAIRHFIFFFFIVIHHLFFPAD